MLPDFIDAIIFEYGPLTLLEIAVLLPRVMGQDGTLSRERVRQLEARALKKLKRNRDVRDMRGTGRRDAAGIWELFDLRGL